jgi:hypothetical protein
MGNIMEKEKKSYFVYFCLVLVLCISAFIESLSRDWIPPGHFIDEYNLAMLLGRSYIPHFPYGLLSAVYRLIAYGGMGLLGVFLASRAGFKNVWNDEINQRGNKLLIISAGIAMGIYFIVYDEVIARKIINVPLLPGASVIPASIFVSLAEGIGDQILNMLRISFFIWLFSKIVKSEKGRLVLFWTGAVLLAVLFTVEHIALTTDYRFQHYRNIFQIPSSYFMLVLGLYAPLSLVCTWFFKKYGLLSAITIHIISDLMWRVLWGYKIDGNLLFRQFI